MTCETIATILFGTGKLYGPLAFFTGQHMLTQLSQKHFFSGDTAEEMGIWRAKYVEYSQLESDDAMRKYRYDLIASLGTSEDTLKGRLSLARRLVEVQPARLLTSARDKHHKPTRTLLTSWVTDGRQYNITCTQIDIGAYLRGNPIP